MYNDLCTKKGSKTERRRSVADKKGGIKIAAQNKKAYHDYFVEDGELFVVGMHISPYEHGNIFNRDPLRKRRLLMHKREILKLHGYVAQKGMSLVPLSLYFSGSRVKVEVGLCKGKKLYDKRESIAKHDADREIERKMKDRSI